MNLKQMRAFNEVMLTRSVSQTARNLNRTQPSISSAISALEMNLGMQLFERKSGRLHPVPEAHYLFEETSELLNRVASISQNMKRITAAQSGELRIASMPGPSVHLIPDIVSTYVKTRPDIKVELVSRSTEAVFQLLNAQQYDIGIADNQQILAKESGLVDVDIMRFPCLCALPPKSPLKEEPIITIDHIKDLPMGSLIEEHSVSQQLKEALRNAGTTMEPKFITQYFIPLLNYVENDLAYAIVDPLSAYSFILSKAGGNTGVTFKPFMPTITFELAILRPKQRPLSLLARDFSKTLLEQLEDLSKFKGNRQPSA